MELNTHSCPSCGQAFAGKFCAACGEKKVSHHDFTLSHFVEETIEGVTHFDNKFLRSIYLLLFRPGALTSNFAIGRKVPFMKPMQLFIVCNLLYFLLVAGTNIFSVSLQRYLDVKGGILNLQSHFISKFGPDADVAQLSQIFSEKMVSQSKAFVILFIPFFAIASALFFIHKKKPFGLHLVFATHFFAFLLLLFTLFRFVVEVPNNYLLHISDDVFNPFAATFNFIALVVYYAVAAHRFYQTKWVWALITGIFAGFIFIGLLQGYRLFLFYNIVRTMT